MISKALVEELQIVAREECGFAWTFEEAQACLGDLINFYDRLAEIDKPLLTSKQTHGEEGKEDN